MQASISYIKAKDWRNTAIKIKMTETKMGQIIIDRDKNEAVCTGSGGHVTVIPLPEEFYTIMDDMIQAAL